MVVMRSLAKVRTNNPAGSAMGCTFVQMLKDSMLVAAFGDEEKAIVMYDTATVLVPSAPGAEWVTVKDGKITRSLFIFDRAPFDAARKAKGAAAT
jgi:hypothetical protein